MPKPGSHTPSTVYHLAPEHDGLTLSAALKSLSSGASWGQVKAWISNCQIQVNGNLCLDPARRVRQSDVIKFHKVPLAKPVTADELRRVYLDAHLLVVEKPAGITSVRHAAERNLSNRRRQLQPTLEELLPPVLAKMQRLQWPPDQNRPSRGGRRAPSRPHRRGSTSQILNSRDLPPPLRVFPVHRLDRDTSGLMLFARSRDVEQRFIEMFRKHTVQREYTAVCVGIVQPQTIHSWLVRDRGDGLRGSVADPIADADIRSTHSDAAEAITHVISSQTLRKADQDYSLIRCRLETGRTHQIRIHLTESGHPICGDKIYRRPVGEPTIDDRSGAPRQALHSDQLEFKHPITGEPLRFSMPLPKDLAAWLKQFDDASQ